MSWKDRTVGLVKRFIIVICMMGIDLRKEGHGDNFRKDFENKSRPTFDD